MEEDLVLEVEQGLKFVIFKIVQLIVNGQHGVKKANAPDHVEVANKLFHEQKKLNLKMEEDLVLENHQGLNIVIFKIVQLLFKHEQLNLTIMALKLANKLVEALEEVLEALENYIAM